MHGRSGCGSLGKTGCALRPSPGTAATNTAPLFSRDGRLTPILTAVAVGRASVQVPVSLHGDQQEKAVLSLGVTYLF
jgi:hypothetical protein